MSTTYDICCHDHKQSLWIGQGSGSTETFRLYRAPENDPLTQFLITHQLCRLQFGNSQLLPIVGYEDLSDYE